MKSSLKSILVIALLFSIAATAQFKSKKKIKGNGKITTEKRTTADYDEIEVLGFLDVDLISGKEGEITVQGEENILSVIKTEVNSGVLKIYVEKNTSINIKHKLLVTVPVQTVNSVSLTGSGDVNGKSIIKTNNFTVKLAGSGDINLMLEATNIDASLSGSGDLSLKGNAESIKANLAGSGDVVTDELITKNADANLSGSGKIAVYCTSKLTARVSGSGDVFYKGEPETKDTKVSGSGTISKK